MSSPSKTEEISLVLSEPEVDLWKLRELALTEGGLINDTLRKRAWPKLVGLHGSLATNATPSFSDLRSKERSRARLPPSTLSTAIRTPLPESVIETATLVEDAPIVSMTPAALPPSGRKGASSTLSQTTPGEPEDDASSVVSNGSVISMSSIVSDASSTSGRRRRKKTSNEVVAECLDADQIQRDVTRCTWHLLSGSQRSRRSQMQNKNKKKIASLLRRKQRRLGNLINLTLVRSYQNISSEEDRLRYYQGYHDVACIFLSALGGGGSGPSMVSSSAGKNALEATAVSMGLDLPSRVLLQVSHSHFRDAMRSNFIQLQSALRLVLLPLIGAFDSQVHAFLWDCEMEPYFALSWIITWFSHDIRDTTLVKRLFDAFLASHPLFPIYLSVAMVLHPTNRMDVLSSDWGDFAIVHQTLAGLPKNSCSVGWKYKVGDGYVSGDEEEDDGTTRSTEMDVSLMSEDIMEGPDDDASECQSMISSNLMHVGSNTRVPFQELIDIAITFMRRIPPRNLLKLARRYHFEDEHLLARTSSIALLQPPPSWGLASTSPSDWVLKQRARESRGMSATSRKDRKRRAREDERRQQASAAEDGIEKEERDNATKRYLEEKNKTLAVIASGYGPGDDEERRRKRRRKLVLRASVAVVVVAVAYGVAVQYRPEWFGRSIEADTPGDSEVSSGRTKGRNLMKNASSAVKRVTKWTRPNKTHPDGQVATEMPSSTNLAAQSSGSMGGQVHNAAKVSSGPRGEKESLTTTSQMGSMRAYSLMSVALEIEQNVDNPDTADAVNRLVTQFSVKCAAVDTPSQKRSFGVLQRAVRMCQAAAVRTIAMIHGQFLSSVMNFLKEMINGAVLKP